MRSHPTHLVRFAAAPCLAAAALTARAQTCIDWEPFEALPPAITMNNASAAFDHLNGVMLIADDADTFEWDGAEWSHVGPGIAAANGTDPDLIGPMVFNAQRGNFQSIVFGVLHEWDGAVWQQQFIPPQVAGPQLSGPAVACESGTGALLVFGGSDFPGGGTATNAFWSFDGNGWMQIVTEHAPPARRLAALCHDSARAITILFGGINDVGEVLGDTWVFDGADWMEITPPDPPPARYWHAMGFDADRAVTVLQSGLAAPGEFRNDTWEFDGQLWVQRLPTDREHLFRYRHSMVYDTARNTMVAAAGVNSGIPAEYRIADLTLATPPEIIGQPAPVVTQPGQPVEFSIAAEVTWPDAIGLEFQWRINGAPIPGATMSSLAFIADALSQGVYDCTVSYGQCGGAEGINQATSLPATLTLGAACGADLNGDGLITSADLNILLGGFGSSCE